MQPSQTRISGQKRGIEELRTSVPKRLFPTIVNSLLEVLVLTTLEDGCKHGDLLHMKPVRDKN